MLQIPIQYIKEKGSTDDWLFEIPEVEILADVRGKGNLEKYLASLIMNLAVYLDNLRLLLIYVIPGGQVNTEHIRIPQIRYQGTY